MAFDGFIAVNINRRNFPIAVMRVNQPQASPCGLVAFNITSAQYGFYDLGRFGVFLNQCFFCLIINNESSITTGFNSVINGIIALSR